MFIQIRGKLVTMALILSLLIPILPASALTVQSTDQWLIATKYSIGGAWVTYYVVITNYYNATCKYDGDENTVNPQGQGGVIKNGLLSGYYPFSQNISKAWVDRYKDYSKYATYNFVVDNSGSICDPNNKPYNFKYTSNVYLYDYYYNELRPFVSWYGNGTLPNLLNLKGNSLYP
jgi:hypothetical protein